MKRILLPVDLSLHADGAVDLTIDLARTFGASVLVLHAYETTFAVTSPHPIVLPREVTHDVTEALSSALEDIAARIRRAGVEVETRLTEGAPSTRILEAIEQDRIDHVVMGTRGTTGLKHLLLGSVTERIVRLAPCPVTAVQVADAA